MQSPRQIRVPLPPLAWLLAVAADIATAEQIESQRPEVTDKQRRALVWISYLHHFHGPPEHEWAGRGGTIAKLMEKTECSRRVVTTALRNGMDWEGPGTYDESIASGRCGGHNRSMEAQIIADNIMMGKSFKVVTDNYRFSLVVYIGEIFTSYLYREKLLNLKKKKYPLHLV